MTLSHRPSDDRGTNFVVGLTDATAMNGSGSRTLRLRLPATEQRWSTPKPGRQARTVIVVEALIGPEHFDFQTRAGMRMRLWRSSSDRVAVFSATAIVVFSITLTASGAPSALSITGISAGYAHTCAITRVGGAKCWGGNAFGELGNGGGSVSSALTPVDVTGLKTGAQTIAGGGQHTCAVTRAGGAKCWGENRVGQVGAGQHPTAAARSRLMSPGSKRSQSDRRGLRTHLRAHERRRGQVLGRRLRERLEDAHYYPVRHRRPHEWSHRDHRGLRPDLRTHQRRRAKCWGWNINGQLGNGSTTFSYTPVDVAGLTSGVSMIAAGDSFTCAVTTGGGAKCWGWNEDGQLGNGSRSVYPGTTPIDVTGLTSGVSAITAGGHHTCALMTSGGVKCWGNNEYGQLGNGSRRSSNTPVDVAGLASGVREIDAGFAHTCALMRGGGVKCWGWNYGRLGNGSRTEFSTKPVDVRLR